ncbi:MAG: hypothetical protein ACLUNO_11325 [Oscillospiraceae bacterium]
MPEALPAVSVQQLQALCGMTYQQRAVTIMRPFLSEFYGRGALRTSPPRPMAASLTTRPLRRCTGSTTPPRFSSSGTGQRARSRTWRCRSCRTCSRRA